MSSTITYTISLKKRTDLYNYKFFEPPTYVGGILNLIISNSGANKSKKIGQVTEIVPQAIAAGVKTVEEYETYFHKRFPGVYEKCRAIAVNQLKKMREYLKESITEEFLVEYFHDLIFPKTFIGLAFQKAIINDLAKRVQSKCFGEATPEQEKQDLDGHINNIWFQIKPSSYMANGVKLKVPIIIYDKGKKKSINYSLSNELLQKIKDNDVKNQEPKLLF